MTIEEALKKDILLDYQKKWFLDRSPVKVWEKSRRIGASYYRSLKFGFACFAFESGRRNELLLFVL